MCDGTTGSSLIEIPIPYRLLMGSWLGISTSTIVSWCRALWNLAHVEGANEPGELIASYRWTNWVWGIARWSSRLQEDYPTFGGIWRRYLNWIKENQKMSMCIGSVGLGNTRISTNYAQKSPHTWERMGFTLVGLKWTLLFSTPTSCRIWNTQLVQGG